MKFSLLVACILGVALYVPVSLRIYIPLFLTPVIIRFRYFTLLIIDSSASSFPLQHHMISAIYVPPEVRSQCTNAQQN